MDTEQSVKNLITSYYVCDNQEHVDLPCSIIMLRVLIYDAQTDIEVTKIISDEIEGYLSQKEQK